MERKTLNLEINNEIKFTHTNLPYYFYFLLSHPTEKMWKMAEFVAHKPRAISTNFHEYWDQIYYLPIHRESNHLNDASTTPMIIDRGTILESKINITGVKLNRTSWEFYNVTEEITFSTVSLYTAHYPKGFLLPPPGEPTVNEAPPFLPDASLPSAVITHPRIRRVNIDIDLTILQPPRRYCDANLVAELRYSTPVKIGRKPLQLLAAGAFMLGALVGGLMGGSIASALIAPLKVEIARFDYAKWNGATNNYK